MSRVVIITGASSGLGYELYKQLSGDKNNIVCGISRTNDKNLENFFKCDISNYEEVKETFIEIQKLFGKIDVMINNAGIGISGALELLPVEDIKKVFDVNFYGALYSSKSAIPFLSENAKIINISSVCAIFSLPYRNIYCASKSAVNMISYGLSMELKNTKIQVCAVCPGDIKTEFTKNRIKNHKTNSRYNDAVLNSEKSIDEKYNKRMSVDYVATKIIKLINKKNIPMMKIIGFKYKILYVTYKVFPIYWIYKFINKYFNKM